MRTGLFLACFTNEVNNQSGGIHCLCGHDFYALEPDKFEFDLFLVYTFNLEDHRARSVRAASNHLVFTSHPSLHDGAALQAGVDVA